MEKASNNIFNSTFDLKNALIAQNITREIYKNATVGDKKSAKDALVMADRYVKN